MSPFLKSLFFEMPFKRKFPDSLTNNYSYLKLLIIPGTTLIVEYALLDVPVAMCAVYTELSSVSSKYNDLMLKILSTFS